MSLNLELCYRVTDTRQTQNNNQFLLLLCEKVKLKSAIIFDLMFSISCMKVQRQIISVLNFIYNSVLWVISDILYLQTNISMSSYWWKLIIYYEINYDRSGKVEKKYFFDDQGIEMIIITWSCKLKNNLNRKRNKKYFFERKYCDIN